MSYEDTAARPAEIAIREARLADAPGIAAFNTAIARETGFVMPKVRVRDDANLAPTTYSIVISGNEVARGNVYPNHVLAIIPDGQQRDLVIVGAVAVIVETGGTLRRRAENLQGDVATLKPGNIHVPDF